MDLETKFYQSRAQGAYRFDPWMAEVDAMNHTAANLSGLVDGIGKLISAAFRGITKLVQSPRKADPIEIEAVKVARPVQLVQATADNDRVAA